MAEQFADASSRMCLAVASAPLRCRAGLVAPHLAMECTSCCPMACISSWAASCYFLKFIGIVVCIGKYFMAAMGCLSRERARPRPPRARSAGSVGFSMTAAFLS